MTGSTASGWLSHDYSQQLSSGTATRVQAPAGQPAAWLSGYGPNTDCSIKLLVPHGAVLQLEMVYADLAGANDSITVFPGTQSNSTETAVPSLVFNRTTVARNFSIQAKTGS